VTELAVLVAMAFVVALLFRLGMWLETKFF